MRKNSHKICKTLKIKKDTWDREQNSETVSHSKTVGVANLIMKKASYCILFPNTLIFLNYPRSNNNATSLAFCCCFQRINVSATKIIIFFLYINTNKRKLQIERVTVLFSEDNLCFLFWLAIETSGPNSLFQCINTSTAMKICW